MLAGLALALSDVPSHLMDEHALHRRVYERGGEQEVQFLLWERVRVLPVWLDGRLQILPWGRRRQESRLLPCTAWTSLATLESGGWGDVEVELVVIPATIALDRGVWYRVREGIRGVAVRDEKGRSVVYVLVEPASHYYEVMTRCPWMPVLLGDPI